MNEEVETAVEFLVEKLNNDSWNYMTIRERKKIIQQALEMEKEQILKAFDEGWIYGDGYIDKPAKEYYSETYKPST